MQYYGQYDQQPVSSYQEENISITLHNRDLWNQFHGLTNEMIVTKTGRRMFPIIAVNIRGLDPDKMYSVELSFDQIDTHRWRFVSAEWQAGMKPDPPVHRSHYQHPDSPNYGRTWMNDSISFPKVKLTNKIDHAGSSQVILNSLHKYRPRISIIDVMSKKQVYETSFSETEFIAVTAYQNEDVKSLKIRYNPFAKAFLDSGNVKREMFEDEQQQQQQQQQIGDAPMFFNQEPSSGGPSRMKLESYRSSPYSYSQPQRKSSPSNDYQYPSSSTSPFDPATSSANTLYSSSSPFLADSTAYYSNSYYPPPSPYYFPYASSSTPSSVPHYPFMSSFTYPFNNNPNFETASFFHMQPPTPSTSTDNNHFTPLLPIKSDFEQY